MTRTGLGVAVLVAAAAVLSAQSLERAEALWREGEYQAANDQFRALVAASPNDPDFRVRWGRLFLERFQPADAARLFEEALELKKDHAGAMVGLALVAAESFEGRAVELAEKALAINPKLLEARELLARLALEDGNHERATEQARMARSISARSVTASAVPATIAWLEGKPADEPHEAEAWAMVGRFFVLNRRYEEGIGYYRKAVELDPRLWRAHSQLGVNLMRLGEEAGARKHLEIAYENGYKDSATVNTLRLMDSYKNFTVVRSGNIVLKLHNKEAELLEPYFASELRRAMAAYDRKYGFKLQRPVQVEVYPDHEDFAVRTLGMPGLGALGVTFGYVIAMDSPSARKPGSFHWASTLWHELSHVYTLEATRHRVPRWFSEGMAVYEETAASPEWGDRLDPQVIQAIREKKLLGIAELDGGFVRPKYPGQVIVSYFQAGRVCSYIERQWGFPKLIEMLRDFGNGASTPAVVTKQLGLEPAEFDRRFLAWVNDQTRTVTAGFDDWRKRFKQLVEAAKAGRHDDVIRDGPAVRDLYPDYVEAASPYELLAEAYTAKNNRAAAAAELERYARTGGRNPAALKRLAALYEEAGKKREAAAALDRLNETYPHDEELHVKLGALWSAEGNYEGAVREYRAVVALKPTDPAAAYFQLARALKQANKAEEAREQCLLSLEAAPGYRPAQKLLLELTK